MFYYLDTSSLLKRYKSETGSDNIDDLFAQIHFTRQKIFTSSFTSVEIVSASQRLLKVKKIARDSYRKILLSFISDIDPYIQFVPISNDIIVIAMWIVDRYSLRPGDALQLACMLHIRDIVKTNQEEITFIASDKSLCSAAVREKITTFDPTLYSQEEWKLLFQ